MQRTVSLVAVMSTAPSLSVVMPGRDSVSANLTCRDGGVMSVSLKPLAYNRGGGVFPAIAILLGRNHSTVKKAVSVGANLE